MKNCTINNSDFDSWKIWDVCYLSNEKYRKLKGHCHCNFGILLHLVCVFGRSICAKFQVAFLDRISFKKFFTVSRQFMTMK